MRIVLVSLFASVLLFTGVANAQSNLILLLSQPGDYIGQGQTYVRTNTSDFGLSGSAATLTVTPLAPYIVTHPVGTSLAVGSVIGWGNDSFGQTDVPTTAANTGGIGSGYYHGLALVPAPMLHLSRVSNGLVIEWSGPGVLQSASAPT